MSKARRALAWSFSSQYLSTVLQFVTTIIISRLLTPAEVGIFSLAATFVLMGQLLRDFGSGQYIIQEKDLTDERIRAAFTVTLTSGWLVAVVVFLLAPYAATFFEEPGVEPVMHLLALNFALIPFGSITMAYLQRQLAFRRTMTVRLTSAFVGSATSIACAFAGMSYISLAWGAVAGSVAAAVMANLVRPRELPRLPGLKGIPRVLSFASQMSTSAVIGQVGPIATDMIIGKLLGAAPLGLLSRSRGVIQLFEKLVMRGLHPVLTPLFAEKHREGKRLATSYLYAVTCITGILWPFYGSLILLAPDFIYVLFGPNWMATVPLVQIASVALMLRGPVMMSNNVFIATGNISVLLRRQLVIMPVSVIVVFFAAHISLEAVVLAGVPMSLLWVFLVGSKVIQITETPLSQFGRALAPSLIVGLASTVVTGLVIFALSQLGVTNSVVRLLGAGISGSLAYVAVLHVVKHPLASEGQAVLRKLTGRPPAGPA